MSEQMGAQSLDRIRRDVETIYGAGESVDGVDNFQNLVRRKMVLPSEVRPYFAVSVPFFRNLMDSYIARIAFDAQWYMEFYPDIAEAVAGGVLADPFQHYLRFGYYEGRLPYLIEVDEAWYLRRYPDIAEAVRAGQVASGQRHFLSAGYREGRLPSAEFTLRTRS